MCSSEDVRLAPATDAEEVRVSDAEPGTAMQRMLGTQFRAHQGESPGNQS